MTDVVNSLVPPFKVYEDYEGHYHIIDATTRIVLSDSYAYDTNASERLKRMEALARALSVAYAPAVFEPALDRLRVEREAMRLTEHERQVLQAIRRDSADYGGRLAVIDKLLGAVDQQRNQEGK